MYRFSFGSKNFWPAWRKVAAIIVCLSMVWVPMSIKVTAVEEWQDGVKYVDDGSGFVVVGYNENVGSSVSFRDGTIGISDGAFDSCFKLKSVTIPGSVQKVGSHAFSNCRCLRRVTINEGVIELGECAFQPNRIEYLSLPRSLHTIGANAVEVDYLRRVVVPSRDVLVRFMSALGREVTFIDAERVSFSQPYVWPVFYVLTDELFWDNGVGYTRGYDTLVARHWDDTMPADLRLAEGTTRVAAGAFLGCDRLDHVTIPGSVRDIGMMAFGFTSLSKVTFERGCETAGLYAFFGCGGLDTVYLPGSLRDLGSSSFDGCSIRKLCVTPDLDMTVLEDESSGIVWSADSPNHMLCRGAEYATEYGASYFDTEGLVYTYEDVAPYREVEGFWKKLPFDRENDMVDTQTQDMAHDNYFMKDYVLDPEKVNHFGDINLMEPPAVVNPFRWYCELPTHIFNNRQTQSINGETSVRMDKGPGVYWLREESTDVRTGKTTHAWYGIGNAYDFEEGSVFHVRWVSKDEYPEEYDRLVSQFDLWNKFKNWMYNGSYIFEVGVTKPDGSEYRDLFRPIKLYVQLGEDWNLKSLKAYWIGSGKADDESVDVLSDSRHLPEQGEYGILTLKHFSPYIVLDDPLEGDEEAADDSQTEVLNLEQNEETDAAKNTSNSEKSGGSRGSQKQTGDVTSIVFIGVLGLLTMLSAAYLMIQKRKNWNRF